MEPPVDKLLFIAASGFPVEEERRVFLDFVCEGDPDRRKRLEGLLEIQYDAEEFFSRASDSKQEERSRGKGKDDGELGARIGSYQLIERVGAGGCGVVYLAEQREPVKRKVALKIIRLGMDTENVIARFNLEREALALMDHPNIARVLDAGATAAGRPYFVMELVDGERITDFCDRKCLGLRQRLELFTSVCEAIQHAHQKGVIHRDIKPSNILVQEHDGRVTPKVIDFGIAKATASRPNAGDTTTKVGQLIGTPAYMSPEQAEGNVDVDTRSDIYGLGALLCELLSGSPPLRFESFNDRGVEEIRSLVREGATAMPSVRLSEISGEERVEIAKQRGMEPQRLIASLEGDLDWIVMKATEKERCRRYETANGLAMDVQRHLREEPVLARPPSRRYLLSKLIRRNRGAFAAGGIALFGLLGGLGVSTWLFLRERDARQEQARLRVVAEQATANEVRLREDARVADLVRQAAVLVKYGEREQADGLLEGVTDDQVPRSLEAASTFRAVASWNLEEGRMEVAAKRFHVLGKVITSVDMSDSESISFDFLSVATAVSEWGQPGQFEELRELAIQRFANSANPIVAEHVIKATLLQPSAPATLDQIKPLTEVLEAALGRKEKSPHLMAWQQFSLALIAYRQGQLEEAADWARSSLVMASNSAPRTVSNRLLLAMVDIKTGQKDAARFALADLRREVEPWIEAPFRLMNPDGTLWYNEYAVFVLLKEAERLLAGEVD